MTENTSRLLTDRTIVRGNEGKAHSLLVFDGNTMTNTEALSTALADRYRILSHLGEGGMATVYLAEDLKHQRKVAVKVLRPELAAVLGAERFVQEIKTTANLQHPHILPLFDSGEADSFLYYVMPFIDGETLRDKLDRETQLGIEEAVRITAEVADALDYAHRQGVIHRDIKPENILLHDGRPMVADFGIALAVSAAAGGRMTETGLSLGTPHYMSPEQATAEKELTNRSDIYSLGTMLFEMLTGDPPHTASSAQAIIMKIVTEEAESVTKARKTVPPHIAAAVAQSLEKLPADRFASAKGFAEALGDRTFTFVGSTSSVNPPAVPSSRRPVVTTVFTLVTVISLTVAAWGWFRPVGRDLQRWDLNVGELGILDIQITDDGSTFVALVINDDREGSLSARRIDEEEFIPISGTESIASGGIIPGTFAISSDGQQLAFVDPESRIKLIPISGGTATTLMTPPAEWNVTIADWGADGRILFHSGSDFYVISELEGEPSMVVSAPRNAASLLPDGSILVGGPQYVGIIAEGRVDTIFEGAGHATYVESGHIFRVDAEGVLFVTPFDLAQHEPTGPTEVVMDSVAVAGLLKGFAVSDNGIVVARRGEVFYSIPDVPAALEIRDLLSGDSTEIVPPDAFRFGPKFSPDGRLVAYVEGPFGRSQQVWVVQMATKTPGQLTFTGDNGFPAWSPNGDDLVFGSIREGSDGRDLYVMPFDNSGPATLALTRPGDQTAQQWLPGGRIVFTETVPDGLTEGIFVLDVRTGDVSPYLDPRSAIVQETYTSSYVAVSPDGNLVAFTTDQNDQQALWVREFPTPLGRYPVTGLGQGVGTNPVWSTDGNQLFYWTRHILTDSLWVVAVDRSRGVIFGGPQFVLGAEFRGWDLHPGGDRVVITNPGVAGQINATDFSGLSVVVNWEQLLDDDR